MIMMAIGAFGVSGLLTMLALRFRWVRVRTMCRIRAHHWEFRTLVLSCGYCTDAGRVCRECGATAVSPFFRWAGCRIHGRESVTWCS